MNLIASLENRSTFFWMTMGILFVVGVGAADYFTGSELSFSLFYLFPIVLVTWFSGKKPGFAISVISAVVWFTADALPGHAYSEPFIRYWNAIVRLGYFVVVTLILSGLKALEGEKELARIDYLTGAANRRSFFEAIQAELERSQRYRRPFTLAFFDIDDFKSINDKFGHKIGDNLLCEVVKQARGHLRKSDFMARLGGDEFVILFPETGENEAKTAVQKIQSILVDVMHRNHWPVTFSFGVLTYLKGQITVDELIKRADDLMYSVKQNGKNAVAFSDYAGSIARPGNL
jgi:diguanylate cyclase (GGDEF)-like protein